MHNNIAINTHYFFMVLATVLAVLATINVPSTRINLFAGAFLSYLLAIWFT